MKGKGKRVKFNEPVFLINGESSTFLDAKELSNNSIILSEFSNTPTESGTIEFSFPENDYVVTTTFDIQSKNGDVELRFVEISNESRSMIKKYIKSKQANNQISLQI